MSTDTRRRALVITPSFFGYERDIVAEFERQGWSTTLIDERPSNSAVMRALLRVRKGLACRRVNKYYRSWQDRLANERFDLILVVKAEVVPRWFLEWLRLANPEGRFVFYTYDAMVNAGNCEEVLHCFDDRFSFDRVDVDARPDFDYVPLFYTNEFVADGRDRRPRSRYGLSFVGTLHTERYDFAQRCFAGRPDTFAFFYVPARWYFALVKYVTRQHRAVPWSDVSFAPLTKSQIANVLAESHAVLDMQRAGQHGLTMRTFEVLASGALLVTTNEAVRAEPFFESARVVVVPSDPAGIDPAELHAELAARQRPGVAPDGFEEYSLASWVRRVTAAAVPGTVAP